MHVLNKISHFNQETIESLISETITWALNKWGFNTRKRSWLHYQVEWIETEEWGRFVYWENTIIIYPLYHKNIGEIIETVLHEFTHHWQFMSHYKRLEKEHGYDNHPFEIEANLVSAEHRLECWRDIKRIFN